MARKLEVEIVGDASSLQRALGQAQRATGGLGGTLAKLGKVAAVGVGAAFAGLGAVVARGMREVADAQQVSARTEAVLRSTGHAAGVTARQVEQLAGALSRKSGVDDEVIQAGQNVLLTFTRIRNEAGKGNDIFDQATRATLDLSVALGKDMASSARIVGRALEDPVRGMGALRRVGVSLSESQQALVRSLVESGDRLGAQRIILDELRERYGGTAEAVGKTLPGQLARLKVAFDEVAGSVAESLVPYLTRLLEWANANMPTIERTIKGAMTVISTAITLLAPVVGALIARFGELARAAAEHWPRVQRAAQAVAEWYRATLQPTIQAVLAAITLAWRVAGDEITTIVRTAFAVVRAVVQTALGTVASTVNATLALLRGDWQEAWREISEIPGRLLRGAVQSVRAVVVGFVALARELATGVVSALATATARLDELVGVSRSLRAVFEWIERNAAKVWGALATTLGELAPKMQAALAPVVDLVHGLRNSMRWIMDKVGDFLGAVGRVGGIVGRLGAIGRIVGRQGGGPVTAGRAYLVGERGPELFVPGRSGQIVPGVRGGATVVVHVSVAGSVIAERDLVHSIRQALNAEAHRIGSQLWVGA